MPLPLKTADGIVIRTADGELVLIASDQTTPLDRQTIISLGLRLEVIPASERQVTIPSVARTLSVAARNHTWQLS